MGTSGPHPEVSVSEGLAGSVTGIATSVCAFVGHCADGPLDSPRRIFSRTHYESQFGALDGGEMGYAVAGFYDNGGDEAWVVRVPGPPSGDGLALIGDALAKTGLYALEEVDLFNLLCLPDLRLLTGEAHLAAAAAAAAYCRSRRAFLLLDLPAQIETVAAAQEWAKSAPPKLGSENGSYAAAYWPEPLVPDPLDPEQPRRIACSGIMAGIYARCDREQGVWRAPAGITHFMAGVVGPAVLLTDFENARINPLGLNAVRAFPAYGTVPFGARTLQGSDTLGSDWKYVPVRRLALFIEESLRRGLAWTVFQPNAELLWATIRLHSSSFLNGLWLQGAFFGASPKDAYFLQCGPASTTSAEIEAGMLNLIVGFAALKPAEFLVLRIQLRTIAPDA